MKCKRHPHENGGGVCASCLRDRLLIVVAAAARQSPNPSPSPENHRIHLSSDDNSGNRCRRFSLFPSLFRSDESETSSWFSALSHRNKKKINKEKRPAMERYYGPSDRGMSPAIDGEDDSDSNASVSGYSTETSSRFRPRATPARSTPDCRGRRHGVGFGFAVCLSPMVRTGHAGGRKHRHPPSDSGFSGDLARNGKPVHFGLNRSRKMADRSRFR